jgi:hypothetical protein
LIPPRYTFFFESTIVKNYWVKRAWPGAILGWVTVTSCLKALIKLIEYSYQ